MENARKQPARSRTERRRVSKALRKQVPRGSHGDWAPAPDRPDPVSLLQGDVVERATVLSENEDFPAFVAVGQANCLVGEVVAFQNDIVVGPPADSNAIADDLGNAAVGSQKVVVPDLHDVLRLAD